MNIRSFFYILTCLILGTQVCISAEIDTELIKKVQQLEKELLDLKKQHQDRVAAKKTPQEPLDVDTLVETTENKSPLKAPGDKKATTKVALQQDTDDVEVTPKQTKKKLDNGNQQLQMSKPGKKQDGKPVKNQEVAEKDEQSPAPPSQAEELYNQAQIFLNQKHPEQAKTILVNLCDSYPESPHYIMAKYWLGEIGLAARDHTNASIAYGEAYSSYKERSANKEQITPEVRNRAIESLAKLAFCLKQLNKKQDACVTLEQFNKEATDVPYNVQRFALQVSDQLKCQKKPKL
jgi:TolA-binding protein